MPSLPTPPELTLDQRIEMTASARDADAIPKVDGAGAVFVDENGERVQRMHNGLKVLADGYCGPWMTQLIERCRGHHEPQEELAFHSLIERLSDRATMIEIGANWSYYSLWFARGQPLRRAFIIEPDPNGLALAAKNLALNGLSADITRGYVGESYAALQASHADPAPAINLQAFIAAKGLDFVDLLHCDAQGAETELIESCGELFRSGRVGWLMVSTHGAPITGDPLTHQKCVARLRDFGATIALEHDVHESYSGDGLIVARFGAAPLDWTFPEISRNRYSSSYYRNPLYDVAAAANKVLTKADVAEIIGRALHGKPAQDIAAALDALASGALSVGALCDRFFPAPANPSTPPEQAAATFSAHGGPMESIGLWLQLHSDTALGVKGERILAPADTVLLPYVFEHGQWQTDSLDLALAHLDRAAEYALIDIGANIGMFSRQFLMAFPRIKACLCVEPDASNLDALKYNLSKFRDRDLRVFPFALGSIASTATFYRDADNIGNYSLNRDAMRNRNFDRMEVRTVDTRAWADEHLSPFDRLILKTDTQGFDETIMTRIPISVWRKVAFASVEIWRIEKPAFDEGVFREIVETFPNWSFRGAQNCPVDEILEYSKGDDWMFYDLYMWR